MASYRRPKGTVVRPVPDWQLANLVYGGVQNGNAGSVNTNVGCINLDTSGGSFVIWDCTITIDRFAAATNPVVTFTSMGIFQGAVIVAGSQASPVDTMFAPGLLFFDANFNVTNITTINSAYVPLSGAGIWRWNNNFPLAVLRPGFALLFFYQVTGAVVGFSAIGEYAKFPE